MIGMFSLRAEAQTEAELETARATFMEGVELSGDAQWAEAAQRFREVLAVRSTAQVQYNLGLALSHTDALVEAAELLRAALDSDELDRRRARDIRRLLEELEPRLARITVRTMGDEAGANVTLDGEAVGLDQIGTAIPVDPGAHEHGHGFE